MVVPGNDIAGIVVQNISKDMASITDFEGLFSIRAAVSDTLVFSAVQLRRKELPVTQSILDAGFIQVYMEPFVNELREVVVQPYNLSGNLATDMEGLQVAPVTAESLGLPNANVKVITQSERRLQEASKMKVVGGGGFGGAGGALSLNPIINAITGRTKMLKNRVLLERKYAQTQQVQQSILDSVFLNELKIPRTKIDDFMYFCEVDEEFQQRISQGDALQLWEYLLRRSKLYRENNDLD